MILCISLNPAVDRTCVLQGSLVPGAVNRMKSVRDYPGGKAVNVARYLRLYDMAVCVGGFSGGSSGDFIETALNAAGARTAFTHTQAATRVNMNVLAVDGTVTELLEPGAEIAPQELLEFKAGFEQLIKEADLLVLSGSLPAGVPKDFYAGLTFLAHASNVPVILDASGAALREGIAAAPELIKPNLSELSEVVEQDIGTKEQAIAAAELIIKEYALAAVVVSMGADGMLYVDKFEHQFLAAPRVNFVNSVSCGDAAVAALAMSCIAKDTPEEILKRAVAISAAAAECEESGWLDVQRTVELYNTIILHNLDTK